MITLEVNGPALYQWDLNRRLILTDVGTNAEVHYSHIDGTKNESLVLLTYEENNKIYADIPNVLLQHKGIISAYVYIEEQNKAYTKHGAEILVLPREKPSDYVYTEEEIINYKSLLKRIERLETAGGVINGIPPGGKQGQLLYKKSDEDYDAEWCDLKIPEQYGLVSYNQDKAIIIT